MTSFLSILLLSAAAVLAAPAADKVTHLPGQPAVKFAQYAGYLDLPVSPQRSLFYWFVEAESPSPTTPVVVWLQGGPGCSSMFGLLAEHGPWGVNANGTLSHRKYSYNRLAHVVYIDSPAGVGFSYDTASNPSTGDNQTMSDSHLALVQFFKNKFPELAQNPVYISGESYGGHYVPQLSWKLLNENAKPNAFQVNVQAMFVGNPWTDDTIDGGSTIDWVYNHALCSLDAYNAVNRECGALKFSKATHDKLPLRDFFLSHTPVNASRRVGSCNSAMNKVYNEITDDIDQYDIYAYCYHNKRGSLDCEDYEAISDYLSDAKVRAALHVRTQYIQGPWSICTNVGYSQEWDSVVNLYPFLIANLQQVMVFSGDVTFNCGFLGSERWIATLNMSKTNGWQAYYTPDKQVAGYYEQWAGATMGQFTFATALDAGHMVSLYQPARGYQLFENFINGVF